MLFGSRLNKLATSIRRALSEYAVLGINPPFVADFIEKKYLTGGASSTFASAITHARAGNATMTDGYGPELVTNGGFDSDSDWTKGTGWSIADGVAVAEGSTSDGRYFEQNIGLVSGKTYSYEINVSGNLTGSNYLSFRFGGSSDDFNITSGSGLIRGNVTASGSGNLRIRSEASSTDITIDNVSVREMPVIKWAPHNLLTYSEDFSNAAWSISNGTINDSETISFTATSGAVTGTLATTSAGAGYTVAVELWSETDAGKQVDIGFNTNNLSNTFSNSITLTSTPTLYTFSKANNTATQNSLRIRNADSLSKTFKVRYARLYRSDLGGMAANPDQPPSRSSYVPTTSAAKYLPRVGHHVYNGSAWVNEGVLAESESRVNQLTYSNSLNQWDAFAVGITTTTATASPDGQTGAYKAVPTTASGSHFFEINDSYPYIKTTTTGTTFTFSIYAKAAEYNVLQLASSSGFAARYQNFDLTNGVKLSGDVVGATIEDVGNGWYRCSVTEITTSGTNGARFLSISANSDITRNQSFAGDGTSGIYVWGAQAEEGHATPSSFIPSDDGTSTATREAESFTIPSANLPWPTPQYIGDELVDNGDFSTDSDWTKASGASITDGQLVLNTGQFAPTYQTITTTTAGGLYRVTADLVSIGSGTWQVDIRNGTSSGTSIVNVNRTTAGAFDFLFVAESSTTSILVKSISTGASAVFDNVSVREIDPMSVSIGMEGRMTYADTDLSSEAFFFQWFAGGTRYIRYKLDTSGIRQGQIDFLQRESTSGLDLVDTINAYLQPDILVPYNIASRHGSTFVNGAESGVALTANTTPTALPDLSSTDLNLAYDYMGTISEFRVWDKDLGDAGIVEATNPSLEPSLSLTFEGTGTSSFTVSDWRH